MVKFLVKVIRSEIKNKKNIDKISHLVSTWYHLIEIFFSLYWDQIGNVKNRAWGITKSTKAAPMGHRRDLTELRKSPHILIKQGNTHACNTFPFTRSSFLTPPRFGSGSTERELQAICASVSVQKGTDISLKHLI